MGRLRRCALSLSLALLLLAQFGCGGGSSSIQPPPPLLSPISLSDFPQIPLTSRTVNLSVTSGSLAHSANLGLTIQTGVVANLPRTAYARTDSNPAMDDPAGEPRHRRIAYDPAHQLVFVANRAMNRIEIFSSAKATRVAQVSLPAQVAPIFPLMAAPFE